MAFNLEHHRFWRGAVIVCCVVTGIALLGIHEHAIAQQQPSGDSDDGSVARSFWELTEQGKIREAVQRFAPQGNVPLISPELPARVDELARGLGGNCYGHVELAHKRFGDRIVYLRYAALFDRGMLGFDMIYWKRQKNWEGYSLRVLSRRSELRRSIARAAGECCGADESVNSGGNPQSDGPDTE